MRTRRGRRAERGSATLETVIVFPVVIGILWLALQVALTQYCRTVALAAAESGARAAALETNTTSDCYQAAEAILAANGDALASTSVLCVRGATTTTAIVSGTPLTVGPWTVPSVSGTAQMPVERIT